MKDVGRMRFLMVAAGYPPLRSAGLETGCQRLAHALGRRGHRTLVLTQKTPNLSPVVEESEGVTVHRVIAPLALGPLWGLSYMHQVRRFALQHGPDWDMVVSHKLAMHTAALAGVATRLAKPSAVLLVNAGEYSDIRILRGHKGGSHLLKKALETKAFFALSAVSRGELMELGVAEDRILPFRYMVDTERFRPAPSHEGHFLFIGRFHEQKNLPLLLKAFARVHGEEPSARLRLIGRGDQGASVRRLAGESSAASAIRIDEWTNDPTEAYGRALAVVSSSNAEGLSNVSVEAASCGVPTILTDVSGVREVLDPEGEAREIAAGQHYVGRGGLIVPPGDEQALAAAMLRLFRESGMRERLAEGARENAVSRFSEQVCVDLFLEGAARIQGMRS